MIHSTSPSDRTARPEALPQVQQKPVVRTPETDRFSAGQSTALHSALASHPEIRPEVVARGKTLAADPNYPSLDILRSIGTSLISSPDLTDDAN